MFPSSLNILKSHFFFEKLVGSWNTSDKSNLDFSRASSIDLTGNNVQIDF